jgi:hypothetical protein
LIVKRPPSFDGQESTSDSEGRAGRDQGSKDLPEDDARPDCPAEESRRTIVQPPLTGPRSPGPSRQRRRRLHRLFRDATSPPGRPLGSLAAAAKAYPGVASTFVTDASTPPGVGRRDCSVCNPRPGKFPLRLFSESQPLDRQRGEASHHRVCAGVPGHIHRGSRSVWPFR